MDFKRLEYMTCTESARVHLGVCRQVMTNIPNPYADHDIIRRSKVFVLRRIQAPHSSRMKNCPRVECRRVSISIGAIYKAAYGILSRRAISAAKVTYTIIRHSTGGVIYAWELIMPLTPYE